MFNRHFLQTTFLLTLLLSAGCSAGSPEESEQTSVLEESIITNNELTPNALIPNALHPNALIPNALIPNALIPNALAPSALSAIKDPGTAGALSRQFMRYLVGCALDSTQTFNFSWVDSSGVTRNESYRGSLGLKTNWMWGDPPSVEAQMWLTGCLAARMNYYGAPVQISMRSTRFWFNNIYNNSEYPSYTYEEGAFFGNIFAATPRVYACYNQAHVARSRSQQRECAAGHINSQGQVEQCGIMQILGNCDSICCGPIADSKIRSFCNLPAEAGGGQTDRITSVYLP